MTRGKLLDRIKVELAGGIAVRVAIGEETNFNLPGPLGWDLSPGRDIPQRAHIDFTTNGSTLPRYDH